MTQNSEVIDQCKLLDEYLSNKDNLSSNSAVIEQYLNCTDNVDDNCSRNETICNPTIHQPLTKQQMDIISKCTNVHKNKSHPNVADMLVDDNGSFVSYPTDDSDYDDDDDDDNIPHDTNTKFINNVQRCHCKTCTEYEAYKVSKSFEYDDELCYDEFMELYSMLKYQKLNINTETIREFHTNDEGEKVIAITDVFNQLGKYHGEYIDDKLNESQQILISRVNDENLALKHEIQDIKKKIRVFMHYLIIFAIIVFVVLLMGCFIVYQQHNVQTLGIEANYRFKDIYQRMNVSMQLSRLQQLEQQYYIHSLKDDFESTNSAFHELMKTQKEMYDHLKTEISKTNNNVTILRLNHENDYNQIEEVPASNNSFLVVLVIFLIIILIMIVSTTIDTETVDEAQSNYQQYLLEVDRIDNDVFLNQNDYSSPDVAINNNDKSLSPRMLSEITDIVDNSFPIRDPNWQTVHVIQSQNTQNAENFSNNELNNDDQYTSNNNDDNNKSSDGGNNNNNNDKNGNNHGQNRNNDNRNNGDNNNNNNNNENNHNGSGNGGDGGDGDKNRKNNDKCTDANKRKKSKKTKKKKQKSNTTSDMENDDEIGPSILISKSAPNPVTKKLNANAVEYKPSSYSPPCNVKIKKNPYNIYVHSRGPSPDLFTIEESTDDDDIAPTLCMLQTAKHQKQIISEQEVKCKMVPSTLKIKHTKNDKKGQVSPTVCNPVIINKKKRKKSKKKKKKKQKDKITPKTNDNAPQYEPNGTLRGKGYIEITKEMFETIIPNTIKESYLNLNHFIDRFTALNNGNTEFDTEIGKIKILNFDFHDKDNNDILYCKCIKSTNRGYVWKIDNLMTAAQIMNEYGIHAVDLPKSPRTANQFISRAVHESKIKEVIINKETIYEMIEQSKWQNENDESVAVFGKENGKRSMTLSVEKMEFIKQFKKYVDNNNNNNNNGNNNGDQVQLIPILIFEGTTYYIEYVWIISIDDDKQNIGISFRYNEQDNNVKITGIHCDKNCLLEQHQLISPDNNCLDNFESNITHLNVYGNPDKFYKDKYKKLKQFIKESVNTDRNHFDVDLFRRNGRKILSK